MSNIVSTKVVNSTVDSSKNCTVVLLLPDSPAAPTLAIAHMLSHELELVGKNMSIADLHSLPKEMGDTAVVSLLEYESPILEKLDENTFEQI